MIQEVEIDTKKIFLDSDRKYTGKENPDDEEKLVRKAVGLPVTKKLIYYADKQDINSAIDVVEYQLIEMYHISDRWYTVEITLADNTKVRIHSGFLSEMQKPSFFDDMAAQEV